MAEREEPERAARQLEQELNNIAGLIGQSSSPSGPTLEELIRKLDQVRTEARHAVAGTQASRALEARQVVMMDDLISRVRAERDPATLQRALQGLYASRDADETDPRLPAADPDYSSGDDSYRPSSPSNEPPASDGNDDDDYIPVPPKPVPALTAAAPASQTEDNSGRASLAAFCHKLVLSRSGAIRRSVVLFAVVLILALILAAVLALHH